MISLLIKLVIELNLLPNIPQMLRLKWPVALNTHQLIVLEQTGHRELQEDDALDQTLYVQLIMNLAQTLRKMLVVVPL